MDSSKEVGRRSTRTIMNASKGAERAVKEFQSASKGFGLTVSIPKTKHMVTGREAAACDKTPMTVSGGEIVGVEEFPYLGSSVAASGRMDMDVDRRIAPASRAFGVLRKAVFLN